MSQNATNPNQTNQLDDLKQTVDYMIVQVQECETKETLIEIAKFIQDQYKEKGNLETLTEMNEFVKKLIIIKPLQKVLKEKINEIEEEIKNMNNDKKIDI